MYSVSTSSKRLHQTTNSGGKMTYTQWLEYCAENNIQPAEWVKDWTKRLLATDLELAGEHINLSEI